MDHVVLALLWLTWCAIHSGMISITAIEFLKRRLGRHFRFYRLLYNLTAVVTIIPVVLYGQSIEHKVLFRWEGPIIVFQVVLLLLALFLAVAGANHYDLLQLVGFRQIATGISYGPLTENGQFRTSGILGITRHPWYLAALLFIWTDFRGFTTSTLVTNIVLTVYLVVGTVLEERKLVIELGDGYREYQRKVSMLFPFKWLKSLMLFRRSN